MQINRWKYFIDEEKTETWLNGLSAVGLQCVGTSCLMHNYIFEQGRPGEYTYRITIMEHGMEHADTVRYLAFLLENGIEYVSHGYRHFILRKKTADGPFELYTDRASLIRSYKIFMNTSVLTAVILLIIGGINGYITVLHILRAHAFAGVMTIVNGFGAVFCLIIMLAMLEQCHRYAARIKRLKREGEIHE
jgi:hypothetical protein